MSNYSPVTVNFSPLARLILYLVSAIGTLVAAYLFNKGFIGKEEVVLWGGFVAIISGLAAFNVPINR